jgi:phosphatidylglycerophosphate synthase
VRIVRADPVIGLILQVTVLTILAVTVGVDSTGWLVGFAVGVVTCAGLGHGLRRAGSTALGPADWVTLLRATLVGGVAALVTGSLAHPAPAATIVGLTIVALILDAVDGKVARRSGTSSGLGARFDMEVDAFLILVLCVYDARLAGGWVLAIGAMRYAFVGAAWLLPWMRAQLPPRYWRKVVAATQGVVMVAIAAAVLPRPVELFALAGALAMLVESFGRDVLWLWLRRPPHGAAERSRRPVATDHRRVRELAVATSRRRAG